MSDGPRFITPIAAARLLGVRDSKVFRWIRSGELPAINLAERQGKRPRYKIERAALDLFLAGRTVAQRVQPIRRRQSASNVTNFY